MRSADGIPLKIGDIIWVVPDIDKKYPTRHKVGGFVNESLATVHHRVLFDKPTRDYIGANAALVYYNRNNALIENITTRRRSHAKKEINN